MAKVSLTQGAKLAGVSRSTLNRHLKQGKVSKVNGSDGKPCVDTSELQRVYGSLSRDTPSQSVPLKQHGTHHDTAENDIEIAVLRAELNATKEQLEETRKDRDEWKGQAKTLSVFLTDMRSAEPTAQPKGFLRSLFGGSKPS
jgi:hypothetical protein